MPRYSSCVNAYRDAVRERFPEIEQVLGQLVSSLDDQAMRRLNDRVALGGESPADVARSELIRLGLLSDESVAMVRPQLKVAISPAANSGGESAAVIRALRRSYPLRSVQLMPSFDPLAEVKDGTSRLALVSAPVFFAPGSTDAAIGQPTLRSGVEAVALAGSSFLHTFALDPKRERFADADLIATGSQGSSDHRAAQAIVVELNLSVLLKPVEAEDPRGFTGALADSGADAAMLMQPMGNATVLELLSRGLPLLPVTGWNRVRRLIRESAIRGPVRALLPRPRRSPISPSSGSTRRWVRPNSSIPSFRKQRHWNRNSRSRPKRSTLRRRSRYSPPWFWQCWHGCCGSWCGPTL